MRGATKENRQRSFRSPGEFLGQGKAQKSPRKEAGSAVMASYHVAKDPPALLPCIQTTPPDSKTQKPPEPAKKRRYQGTKGCQPAVPLGVLCAYRALSIALWLAPVVFEESLRRKLAAKSGKGQGR